MLGPDFRVYLITDRRQTNGRPLLEVLEQAFRGGVRAVQVREKDLSGRELYELAEQVRDLARGFEAQVLINDRVDIALALKLDGVHVPVSGFPVAEARKLLGPKRLIGASTHSLLEAEAAEQAGADFITFGPVYATASKARYGPPVGAAALAETMERVSIPVYALGGVAVNNLAEIGRAGAFGIAMISAILTAANPEKAAKSLIEQWPAKAGEKRG